MSRRWVGSLSGESEPVLAAGRFVLVGVEWHGPREARIELRAKAPNGRWSPWAVASTLGHDSDGSREGERGGPLFGEPIWTGTADRVQLRSDRPVHGVRLAFVGLTAPAASTAAAAAALPPALPVLDAGPGQPPIIARRAWAHGHARPRHKPEYGSIKLGFVHHTASPNGYGAGEVPAMLMAIYAYHVHVRGWWDIGYNFAVDRFGRIWEARAGGIDMPVIGAQAGGYNAESTGVAVLGDFMNVVPSKAAVGALERLLAWKLSLHGVPTSGHVTVVVARASASYTPFRPGAHVSLPRVAGHRQGDTTDCPGNAFFARLPSIRPRITRLAGTPARITLDTAPREATAGLAVSLSGQLTLLTDAPLAQGPVELQQLERDGARTVLLATTDSQGSWNTAITLRHNAALRALHRPHPATVSDWREISIAPAITLELVSTSPPRVSGTISPSKSHVTIDVYRAAKRLGKPVSHKRLAVANGSFQGKIEISQPGSFVLIARSHRDSTNAPGASTQLAISVP
ncbi:MAG TPA: N-acetylmuramoyl-L-alanine amidase [Solirubrobacteraceae bacterium]|nr:N-acetylmuramoyl-L-alanine amidase [Solirubrobacteraceae bacterium]